jgi:heme A synthase
MEGGLAGIHELLGGIVVVAFIVTAVMAAVEASGRGGDATRVISYAAAALLALQVLLGVLLLGSNFRNSTSHYVIALLILVPVALQHGAGRRLSPRSRGVATMIWSLAAAFLSIIAYITGMQGAG